MSVHGIENALHEIKRYYCCKLGVVPATQYIFKEDNSEFCRNPQSFIWCIMWIRNNRPTMMFHNNTMHSNHIWALVALWQSEMNPFYPTGTPEISGCFQNIRKFYQNSDYLIRSSKCQNWNRFLSELNQSNWFKLVWTSLWIIARIFWSLSSHKILPQINFEYRLYNGIRISWYFETVRK